MPLQPTTARPVATAIPPMTWPSSVGPPLDRQGAAEGSDRLGIGRAHRRYARDRRTENGEWHHRLGREHLPARRHSGRAREDRTAGRARTKTVDQAESLYRHVLGSGYYHHKRAAVMAICAVEMAMWDAFGKACGQPLHRLWGGVVATQSEHRRLPLFERPDQGGRVTRARSRDRGFDTFKLKIGYDERFRRGLTRAVREAIGPDAPLRLDVNGAWTPGTARRQCAKLAAFDPAYVEQPLEMDDLAGHALLRRSTVGADRARRNGLHVERRWQHRARRSRRCDPARSTRGR